MPFKNNKKITFLIGFFSLCTLLWASLATASLLVAPIRVVFNDRTRSATVLILNTDTKVHTYRMGWKLLRATEDGKYVDVQNDESSPYSVPKMVIFSPRQVTIEPDGRQNIRLSLRRPPDLPAGEYRAHLVMEELPEDNNKDKKEKGVTFALNVAFGLSIPVIVRQGEAVLPSLKVDNLSIQNPTDKDQDKRQKIIFDILRDGGNRSTYGRLDIYLDNGGKLERIGARNNIALFNEINKRSFAIEVSKPLPAGAAIKIVYEGVEEYAGKTLAERTFRVQ
jgi:P pilus assembly chaperone PapD